MDNKTSKKVISPLRKALFWPKNAFSPLEKAKIDVLLQQRKGKKRKGKKSKVKESKGK